jgi:hypothetical protein
VRRYNRVRDFPAISSKRLDLLDLLDHASKIKGLAGPDLLLYWTGIGPSFLT